MKKLVSVVIFVRNSCGNLINVAWWIGLLFVVFVASGLEFFVLCLFKLLVYTLGKLLIYTIVFFFLESYVEFFRQNEGLPIYSNQWLYVCMCVQCQSFYR